MAERATIARPYAKAAFEFARDANALPQWSEGLKVAAQIVADPRVESLVKDPARSVADVVDLITGVAGEQLDAGMRNFLSVLAENHRLLLLPEVSERYEAERAEVENTVDLEVISAIALDAAQKVKFEKALSARLKRRVRMQNTVDASLMGGAVVRAGDLVIDGSVKGRLQQLATVLGD